jgi:hypothetical protein
MSSGNPMPVSFASLDQRLSRDLRELHDFLWDPMWKGDEGQLRTRLLKGARDLDTFLRTGGRIRKNVERLAKPWSRENQGSSLFELLDDAVGLTAATEHVRQKEYREAAVRAQAVIESTSIGVCSAAQCFEIVTEWEGGKIDFETYTTKLTDVLQSKLIMEPGQFKRVLNSVHEFGANWDASASVTEQALAARAAIASAGWCVSRSVAIREMLGEPPKVPADDFARVLEQIVRRL